MIYIVNEHQMPGDKIMSGSVFTTRKEANAFIEKSKRDDRRFILKVYDENQTDKATGSLGTIIEVRYYE